MHTDKTSMRCSQAVRIITRRPIKPSEPWIVTQLYIFFQRLSLQVLCSKIFSKSYVLFLSAQWTIDHRATVMDVTMNKGTVKRDGRHCVCVYVCTWIYRTWACVSTARTVIGWFSHYESVQISICCYKPKAPHLLNAPIYYPVSCRLSLTETIHSWLTVRGFRSLMEFVHSINKSVKLLLLHILPIKFKGRP